MNMNAKWLLIFVMAISLVLPLISAISINYAIPTTNNDTTFIGLHYNIISNVSIINVDTDIKNASWNMYNSTWDIIFSSESVFGGGSENWSDYNDVSQNDSVPYYSFIGLPEGTYYFNATACDVSDVCNSTETRTIYIINSISCNVTSPTDGQVFGKGDIVTVTESADILVDDENVSIYNMTLLYASGATLGSMVSGTEDINLSNIGSISISSDDTSITTAGYYSLDVECCAKNWTDGTSQCVSSDTGIKSWSVVGGTQYLIQGWTRTIMSFLAGLVCLSILAIAIGMVLWHMKNNFANLSYQQVITYFIIIMIALVLGICVIDQIWSQMNLPLNSAFSSWTPGFQYPPPGPHPH